MVLPRLFDLGRTQSPRKLPAASGRASYLVLTEVSRPGHGTEESQQLCIVLTGLSSQDSIKDHLRPCLEPQSRMFGYHCERGYGGEVEEKERQSGWWAGERGASGEVSVEEGAVRNDLLMSGHWLWVRPRPWSRALQQPRGHVLMTVAPVTVGYRTWPCGLGSCWYLRAKLPRDPCCVGDVGLQVTCKISVHGQRHCWATGQLPVDFTGHYKLQLGSQTGPLVPRS